MILRRGRASEPGPCLSWQPLHRSPSSTAQPVDAINSRKVDLLDEARLIAQIVGLERGTARGGKDSIDHAPNAHDDLANSVAGVVAALASSADGYDTMKWVG